MEELLKQQLPSYCFNNFVSVNKDRDRMVNIKGKETSILILANKLAKTKPIKGILRGTK